MLEANQKSAVSNNDGVNAACDDWPSFSANSRALILPLHDSSQRVCVSAAWLGNEWHMIVSENFLIF